MLDTLKDNYYSGQGDVLIAKRDSSGNPGSFFMVGNAPKFELAQNVERRKHQESRSGNRLTDKVQSTTKGGRINLTLEDIRKDNVALLLGGSKVAGGSGSYSSGSPDTFPSGLAVGSIVKLAKPNASSIVVKDSAGTPATLTLNTHYRVLDADFGLVEILSLGSFTQPFKAEYSYAATDFVTALTANDDDEYFVYGAMLNTEGTPADQKVGVSVYRVVFDPAALLALINNEQGSFDISGEVLRDNSRAADANFGGFARFEYVDANS